MQKSWYQDPWHWVAFVMLGAAFLMGASLLPWGEWKSEVIAAWVQAIGSIGAIVGASWIAIAQTAKQHRNALELLRMQEAERQRVARDRAVLCAGRVTPPMLDAANAIRERGDTWGFSSDVVSWHTYFDEEHRLDQARAAILTIAGDPAFDVAPQDLEAMTPLPDHAALRLSRANGQLRQLRQRIEATVWYPEHSEQQRAADVERWHAELVHIGMLLLPALKVCQETTSGGTR